MADIASRGYANPDALVSTDWVQQNLQNQSLRFVESNEDQLLYRSGHMPGAVEIDWVRDLNDPLRRDYIGKERFEVLMSSIGASPDTTIVLYGDKNNWWASYAMWVFHLFGHTKTKIMDGGRLKWQKENRPMTRDVPTFEKSAYGAKNRDDRRIRAFRESVLEHVQSKLPLIDVRSPEEYSGARLHMEAYPNEGALRGGHIPGAKNVPWARVINQADYTFLPAPELRAIYEGEAGLKPTDNVVVYCRIGERSSHTWFVLSHLLGYENVRNYDGSWTEWGNLVGVPIER